IKNWLLAPDPATDRNNALAKRQTGTGDWILRTKAFKKWRSSGENPVLWLHGQSGSGKTVLRYLPFVLVSYMLLTYAVVHVLFTNFSLAFPISHTSSLLSRPRTALMACCPLSLSNSQLLRRDTGSFLKHTAQIITKGLPPRVSLFTYVEKMLAVPLDVTLVVDALDEHPVPRDELLKFLTKLSRDHRDHVRLLVTSRDEADIHAAMTSMGASEVDLSTEVRQREDIYKYVTSVLQSDEPFRTWTNSTLELIKRRLLDEGMFRLVALQLERLRNSTPIDVEATLKTLHCVQAVGRQGLRS
ncbi:hypothetical protein C8J57DRAFT_1589527, partial [Mycena rebaudengoi]